MTKTLTEQWKNGELPTGEYYLKLDDGSFTTDKYYGEGFGFSEEIPDEVLASVPTYAEFKDLMSNLEYIDKYREFVSKTERLEKKLAIATKALNKIIRDYEINGIGYLCVTRAKTALKEIEGVK